MEERMTHRKLICVLTAVAVTCLLVMPILAGDETKEVALTGWIADKWCGAKNANGDPASVACAKSCAEKGSPMVLVADGKTYELSDKKLAVEHIGYEVVVTGTLVSEDKIEVKSIEKAEKV